MNIDTKMLNNILAHRKQRGTKGQSIVTFAGQAPREAGSETKSGVQDIDWGCPWEGKEAGLGRTSGMALDLEGTSEDDIYFSTVPPWGERARPLYFSIDSRWVQSS